MTPPFRQRILRALLLGLPGVLVLPFVLRLPPQVPPAAAMANPALFLTAAALIGAWASHKAGLTSAIILGSPLRLRSLACWATSGLVLGHAIAWADHATAPIWAAGGIQTLREGRDAASLALGLLYGGLTEEIIFRWGILSLFATGLLSVLPRHAALATATAASVAIFALAHLPAVILDAGIATWGLTWRTLLWNTVLGITFGLAFLRHGLEGAIAAHMGTHVGLALAALP